MADNTTQPSCDRLTRIEARLGRIEDTLGQMSQVLAALLKADIEERRAEQAGKE